MSGCFQAKVLCGFTTGFPSGLAGPQEDQMLADTMDAEVGPAVSLFSGKCELGAVSDRSYEKLNRTNKSSESLSLEPHFPKPCLCA